MNSFPTIQTVIALLVILATQAFSASEIHVSPAGNDANDGSAKSPVATLEAARALLDSQPAAIPTTSSPQGPRNFLSHLPRTSA